MNTTIGVLPEAAKAPTPEQEHQREMQAAELTVQCAFLLGRSYGEVKLLLDKRLYAETFETKSKKERLNLSRHIWNELQPHELPPHEPKMRFTEFHNALWAVPDEWLLEHIAEESTQQLPQRKFFDDEHRFHVLLLDRIIEEIKIELKTSKTGDAVREIIRENPILKWTNFNNYRSGKFFDENGKRLISLPKRAEIEAAIVSSAKKRGIEEAE